MFKSLFALSTLIASSAIAMDYEAIKVSVWKKTETIMGEEFIAATESVADYVAALPRPVQPLKPNQFECQVKGRATQPTIQQSGPTPTYNSWTNIIMVYDIKDCVALRD